MAHPLLTVGSREGRAVDVEDERHMLHIYRMTQGLAASQRHQFSQAARRWLMPRVQHAKRIGKSVAGRISAARSVGGSGARPSSPSSSRVARMGMYRGSVSAAAPSRAVYDFNDEDGGTFDEEVVEDEEDNGLASRRSTASSVASRKASAAANRLESHAHRNRDKQGGWVNTLGLCSVIVDVSDGAVSEPGKFYAWVCVDSKTYQTTTNLNATSAPIWCDHFEFPLLTSTQHVLITVWRKTLVGADSFVGRVVVPIADIGLFPKKQRFPMRTRDLREFVNRDECWLTLEMSLSRDEPVQSGVKNLQGDEAPKSFIKGLVSKQKRRFQEDGFDLDLSYITDRLIAMGYPSESLQGLYRNSMSDVQRFLNTRHRQRFFVYNLCAEMSYDSSKFDGRVARFPFDDHNPPPFDLIPQFCAHLQEFLSEHPQHVAAIHCKAGKGRTGTLISCYMVHSQFEGGSTAAEALKFFGERRTKNGRGVTIPSQIRYVHYYEKYLLSQGKIPDHRTMLLSTLTVSRYRGASGSDLMFAISCDDFKYYSKGNIVPMEYEIINEDGSPTGVFDVQFQMYKAPLPLSGDVKIVVFASRTFGKEKVFQCWFNTRFSQGSMTFHKQDLDKAVKDVKHKLQPAELSMRLEFDSGQHERLRRLFSVTASSVTEKVRDEQRKYRATILRTQPPKDLQQSLHDDDDVEEDDNDADDVAAAEAAKASGAPKQLFSRCGGCGTFLTHPPKAARIQCPHCGLVIKLQTHQDHRQHVPKTLNIHTSASGDDLSSAASDAGSSSAQSSSSSSAPDVSIVAEPMQEWELSARDRNASVSASVLAEQSPSQSKRKKKVRRRKLPFKLSDLIEEAAEDAEEVVVEYATQDYVAPTSEALT